MMDIMIVLNLKDMMSKVKKYTIDMESWYLVQQTIMTHGKDNQMKEINYLLELIFII